MIAYLDSSVLISRVFLERPDFAEVWDRVTQFYSSRLLRVECMRTAERFKIHHGLSEEDYAKVIETFEMYLARVSLLSLNNRLIDQATRPMGTRVRALDAIHLTTARILRDESLTDLVFLTHDRELSETARVMGFKVEGV